MTSPSPSPSSSSTTRIPPFRSSSVHGYHRGHRRYRDSKTRMFGVMMIATFIFPNFQLPLEEVESFSFYHHHHHHDQRQKQHRLKKTSIPLSPQRQWKQQRYHQRPMVLVGNLNSAAVGESENREDSNSHRRDSSLQPPSSSRWKVARKWLIVTMIVSLVIPFGPVIKAACASSSTLSTTATIAGATTANFPIAAAAPTATTTGAATAITAASCPVSAMTEIRLSLRLLYAALLGAALGKERSYSKHGAGLRTMALVSMGAAAFTVCSSYGFSSFIEVGCRYDPSRMAANVVSGVGFVGAGVITTSARNNENIVHGLTTAATIWLSAAVGCACGVGLSRIATTAAITTLAILRLGRTKKKLNENRYEASHEEFAPSSTASMKPQVLSRYRNNTDDKIDVRSYEGRVMNDHDVNEAEIHLTSEWNENNQQQEEQGQQIHPPTSHATNVDIHRQRRSNEQTYTKQLGEQGQEEPLSWIDDVSNNDISDDPSQLLDAARTYQGYNLNTTTSFDFDEINAISKNSKKKKVASTTSARASSLIENQQDKYYP